MDEDARAYRGLKCRGCGARLDNEGYCPTCEPEASEESTLILDQPRPKREDAPHPGGELNL